MLVSDGHSHVSPLGLGGREVARKFREAGGWFIALVSLPPNHYGLNYTVEDVIRSFEIHVRQCAEASGEGVEVACLAGVHPSVIDRWVRASGPSRTAEVVKNVEAVLNVLRRYRAEGLIDGYGEFGRPHYKALPESVIANELVTIKVLELMKDLGGVVHLHLEQAGEATALSVDALARSANLSVRLKSNVVLHHSTIAVGEAAEHLGFSYTLTARSELLMKALSKGLRGFIPESDFIDDPRRPGVVMYPWEIAVESQKLLNSGVGEEMLLKVMVDNVVKLYGVEPP